MAQGRGSAKPTLVLGVAILCLLALAQSTFGATYSAGGPTGWTFNMNNWPSGKIFKAGDILVFNYPRSMHNVVAVSKRGYNSCTISKRARVYRSGSDKFKLRRGLNYFICAVPGHCKAGMKIAVKAI